MQQHTTTYIGTLLFEGWTIEQVYCIRLNIIESFESGLCSDRLRSSTLDLGIPVTHTSLHATSSLQKTLGVPRYAKGR